MMGHGGKQADMVLEKELRVEKELCLIPQALGSGLNTGPWIEIYEFSKSAPTVTQFLKQGHTYFREVIMPLPMSLWGQLHPNNHIRLAEQAFYN